MHLARNEWEPVSAGIGTAMFHARGDLSKPKRSYLMTVLALVHVKASKTDEAVKSLNEAIKFDLRNDLAYLERGRLYLALGKISKAQSDFEEAAALGNEQARQLLASMAR